MVENGFYDFLNWFDDRAWYPLGRIVGGTVYPGLMITSGSIHYVLSLLNIPTNIRDVCVFLAPLFSGLTAIGESKILDKFSPLDGHFLITSQYTLCVFYSK